MPAIFEKLDLPYLMFPVFECLSQSSGKRGIGEPATTGGAGVVLYPEFIGKFHLGKASPPLYCQEFFSVDPLFLLRNGGLQESGG